MIASLFSRSSVRLAIPGSLTSKTIIFEGNRRALCTETGRLRHRPPLPSEEASYTREPNNTLRFSIGTAPRFSVGIHTVDKPDTPSET
jgi:hypothetical protein